MYPDYMCLKDEGTHMRRKLSVLHTTPYNLVVWVKYHIVTFPKSFLAKSDFGKNQKKKKKGKTSTIFFFPKDVLDKTITFGK